MAGAATSGPAVGRLGRPVPGLSWDPKTMEWLVTFGPRVVERFPAMRFYDAKDRVEAMVEAISSFTAARS